MSETEHKTAEQILKAMQDELEYRVRTAVALHDAAGRGWADTLTTEPVQDQVEKGRGNIAALASGLLVGEPTEEQATAAIQEGLSSVDWDEVRTGDDPEEAAAHAIRHAVNAFAAAVTPQEQSEVAYVDRDEALEAARVIADRHHELVARLTDAPSPDREMRIADEIEYRVRTAVARFRLAEKQHGIDEALEAVNGEIRAGRRAAAALAVPVEPVDEAKLAEVLNDADVKYSTAEHIADSGTGPDPGPWFQFIAHEAAVRRAEWLRGDGR